MRVGINGMGRIGRSRAAGGDGRDASAGRRSACRQPAGCRARQRGQGWCGGDRASPRIRQPARPLAAELRCRGRSGDPDRQPAASASRPQSAPDEVPWGDLGCDIVLECTGKFLKPDQLQGYFDRGVRRVIVAAPVKDAAALNVVVGVNDDRYDPAEHRLLTAASCTTNCLAPVVKVVHEAIGIRHGQITTIHDPTNTNVVVDAPHRDLRRARSAMLSMLPTTTGSATAIALIYPELKGRLNGHAVRVPVLNASLTDCVFELERPTSEAEVNDLFRDAAVGSARRHSRLRDAAARLGRLRQRHAQRHRRRPEHDGHRRHAIENLCVVRQRGRLCLPHGRPGQHRHRARCMMARHPQLPDRHGQLLELYAHRRRAAHVGAAAFLHARLHAVHAGVAVPALRDRRHLRQSRRRLAGDPLRHPAHARRWAWSSRSAGCCCCRVMDPTWSAAFSVAWVVASQGISGVAKDVTKTASKSAIKATSEGGAGQLFKLGRVVHRLEERDEGFRFLCRRAAASNWSVSARRSG